MSSGSDSKYFSTQKKGEIHELRNELNSNNRDKVKDAVKKVIASMTIGKDVSALFTDVIKRMQTDNIELKKLIYLYIINYARSQPDKAILVINSFQKDSQDRNPLIRALAIRTMGCIRVERITQFLCDPLQACLNDSDPYVRKTSAICVAKLFDVNPELVEEQGFIDTLRHMLTDGNHTVVANAVAALSEIGHAVGRDLFQINPDLLSNLLTALNSCTEWGQVSILECLSNYHPTSQEAEDVIERITPRLKHANSAVSMAAIKLIVAYLPYLNSDEARNVLLYQKLPPPLITLLGDKRPEIQYVALRNISLLVQKYPTILAPHIKHFFCKYTDPPYVKVEKLELMVRLINADNMDKVLLEFKEYAGEADVEFVRKAIRAIGRCAISLPECAQRSIAILLTLIENRVNYVVQESILVIKNIFRRYPEQYESVIATLCSHLDSLDDNEAKAAMIWIVGEYCHRISNAGELLSLWSESLLDEQVNVQLQLLTAVVKLFLKVPEAGQELVTNVLTVATKQVDNPDVRDRALIYWRLLSTDPDAAIRVVFSEKPTIRDDSNDIDHDILQTLLQNLSTLASVYHKAPNTFVKESRVIIHHQDDDDDDDDANNMYDTSAGGSDVQHETYVNEDDDVSHYNHTMMTENPQQFQQQTSAPIEIDLLGLTGLSSTPMSPSSQPQQQQQQQQQAPSGGNDILDMILGTPAQQQPQQQQQQQPQQQQFAGGAGADTDAVLVSSDKGGGVEIRGHVTRMNGNLTLSLLVTNHTAMPITALPLKFNVNYLGLSPVMTTRPNVLPGASDRILVGLNYNTPSIDTTAKSRPNIIQVAVKLSQVAYFTVDIDFKLLFDTTNLLSREQWLATWPTLNSTEQQTNIPPFPTRYITEDALNQLLSSQYGFIHHATRSMANGLHLFYSSRWRNVDTLVEVVLNNNMASIQVRCQDHLIGQNAANALQSILQ